MTMPPDTKDWTWVLERPCPDCGFDARTIEIATMPDLIRDWIQSWRAVLARTEVDVRPSPTTWSPLEYGCHVRDLFRVMDDRVGLMCDDDGVTFANWDQDRTAEEDQYDRQNPSRVADELAYAGEALASRFERVEPAQWSHQGFRSNGSVFSVETLARYLAHDPLHHLWDVAYAQRE